MNKRSEPRRGVILLVVLGLLTLFALMTMTFILVAAQARRTAQATTEAEQYGDPPQTLLDEAALQVLRGTNNPLSVLRPHSLLEDIYGNASVTGEVGDFVLDDPLYSPANGSFISLVVDVLGPDGAAGVAGESDDGDAAVDVTAPSVPDGGEIGFGDDLSPHDGFYTGRVITMLDGYAKGQSARIVGYKTGQFTDALLPGFYQAEIRLLPFASMSSNAAGTGWNEAGAPRPGDRFVISGTPFSGTGFGYQTNRFNTSGLLDAFDPSFGAINPLYALLPNPVFFEADAGFYTDPAGMGGANEDYDAVDFQNMLLALQASTTDTTSEFYPTGVVIPSLHRPELINYWYRQMFADVTNIAPTYPTGIARWEAILRPNLVYDRSDPVELAEAETILRLHRKLTLRPLRDDHPDFTGSNPAIIDDQSIIDDGSGNPLDIDYDGDGTKDRLQALQGPWDVDNDGDGKPDSIWVDLGFPAQTTADGRQYKPLFAILCLDLDGRLNLNAHGSLAHFDTSVSPPTPIPSGLRSVSGPYAGGAAGTPTPLPMGQGYGPAEISLWPVLENDYGPLLFSETGSSLDGRYGERTRTFAAGAVPGPGLTFFDAFTLGTTREPDWQARVKFFDYPGVTYPGFTNATIDNPEYHGFMTAPATYLASAYGTPPDIDGNGVVGVDLRGVPYWPNDTDVGMGIDNERGRNPYKLDLSLESRRGFEESTGLTSVDHPFTLAELERALRYADLDSTSLPDRLLRLTNNSLALSTPEARQRRSMVTTESWDLPTPNLSAIPSDIAADALRIANVRQNGGAGITIADILLARLANETPPALTLPALPVPPALDLIPALNDPTAADFALFSNAQQQLLAPELRAGLRFDINRPFGSGRDDTASGTAGYNVIDEPGEGEPDPMTPGVLLVETIWPSLFPDGAGGLLADVDLDLNNDGSTVYVASEGMEARYVYAKQLYCLAWLLMESGYRESLELNHGVPTAEVQETISREIAQWVVNVVDFRDSDSIMTPFEYDENVLDGSWDVDGNMATVEASRGLVWGCERPELLITETLAFHDRRVELNGDMPPMYEQTRKPEGSLFIELHNPSNPMDTPAAEVTATLGNEHGVDLQGTTPGGDPVWRLLITKRPTGGATTFDDPDDPDVDISTEIERSVYFVNAAPASIDGDGQQYYLDASSPTIPPVLPGRYAVVGPPSGHSAAADHTTYVGKRTDGAVEPTRKIVLTPNADPSVAQVNVVNNDDAAMPSYPAPFQAIYPDSMTDIQPPLAVVIGQPRRLSVSEPVTGYPAETELSPGVFGYDPPPPPIDAARASGSAEWQPVANTGTEVAFRAVHLQRLANPLWAWNPESGEAGHNAALPVNPYLTIDRMPIDLTAFNGSETGGTPEPGDGGGTVMFESRQRGETVTEAMNLWAQESMEFSGGGKPAAPSPENVGGPHYFDYPLKHSLGYLNMTFGEPWNSTDAPVSGTLFTAADYRGAPNSPFPWLVWNNRPFISQYELFQVPAVRSSQLLDHFSLSTPGSDKPYEPQIASTTLPPWFTDLPYRHLPNFFQLENAASPTTPGPGWFRLFEYLHVPSRFVGTETVLNPDSLAGNPLTVLEPTPGWNHSFHPPLNRVSRYRDPGRININTIYDESVWQGVWNSHPLFATSAFFTDLVRSRRGYDSLSGDPFEVNQNWPTRFGNPFRSFGGNQLVPLASMQQDREIDTTLLRSKVTESEKPLFALEVGLVNADPDRNTYFRYQGLQKLGNLVTTRSNVYAVWITVGYFEVEQGPVDAGHPDGYRLGRELGIETGEVQRHRSFYVFDRTVPVGFERGKDHNVQRAMRLRRFIE